MLGLQFPLDVHTEAEQYAVIICEQFRPRYRMDLFIVLSLRIADEVIVITSIWEMYGSCLFGS